MDVETGRLLSAGVKFTRFTEQIIKTLSPIQNKHILFLKIRYKYNYIFHLYIKIAYIYPFTDNVRSSLYRNVFYLYK